MRGLARRVLWPLIPEAAKDRLRALRDRAGQAIFSMQGSATIRCGRFDLEVPSRHLLRELVKTQPDRDRCISVAAGLLGRKYPAAPIVDIGANIGDTAALIASEADNPLILVEPSDFFLRYLRSNMSRIGRSHTILDVLVSDEAREVRGELRHWGGTANLTERDVGGKQYRSLTLAEIAPVGTCFVKIDTDGFDFRIITAASGWWAANQAAVMFESQVDTPEDLAMASRCIRQLWDLGYRNWIIWDDPGHHMASLQDLGAVIDMHRFLLALQQRSQRFGSARGVCNLDVLALHDRDIDVFGKITAQYR